MIDIKLIPLSEKDKNQFILDNQEAFAGGIAYRIVNDGAVAGGMVLRIKDSREKSSSSACFDWLVALISLIPLFIS